LKRKGETDNFFYYLSMTEKGPFTFKAEKKGGEGPITLSSNGELQGRKRGNISISCAEHYDKKGKKGRRGGRVGPNWAALSDWPDVDRSDGGEEKKGGERSGPPIPFRDQASQGRRKDRPGGAFSERRAELILRKERRQP